jgi:hypothetical protein
MPRPGNDPTGKKQGKWKHIINTQGYKGGLGRNFVKGDTSACPSLDSYLRIGFG